MADAVSHPDQTGINKIWLVMTSPVTFTKSYIFHNSLTASLLLEASETTCFLTLQAVKMRSKSCGKYRISYILLVKHK